MQLTHEFLQKFVGWQVQIIMMLEESFYQGEIKAITIQQMGEPGDNHLIIDFAWMAYRFQNDPWQKAQQSVNGEMLDIMHYEGQLDKPIIEDKAPTCFSISLISAEQILVFFDKSEVNWIDPKTVPWVANSKEWRNIVQKKPETLWKFLLQKFPDNLTLGRVPALDGTGSNSHCLPPGEEQFEMDVRGEFGRDELNTAISDYYKGEFQVKLDITGAFLKKDGTILRTICVTLLPGSDHLIVSILNIP